MEKGYFAAAWGDITKSPGWISKLLRLGLLLLVPVFGQIVAYGYLYGWARDIAWNVHRPLPSRIFGNEDGNLYKRGFFIFLIALVFCLVPGAFNCLSSLVSGTTFAGGSLNIAMNGSYYTYAPIMGGVFLSMLLGLISFILAFAVAFFAWVGSMRTALYGTLSAGFQLNKIWAMLRYDFMGLLRIFAMALIVGLVIGFFLLVALFLFVLMAGVAAIAASLGGSGAFSVALVGAGVFCLLGVAFLLLAVFCIALSDALVIRALGYWTRQFEVNRWGGQEDPMPFEQRAADLRSVASQQPAGQQGGGSGQQQPGQTAPDSGEGEAASGSGNESAPGAMASQTVQAASFDPAQGVPVQTAPCPASDQPVRTAPLDLGEAPSVREADASDGVDEGSSTAGPIASSAGSADPVMQEKPSDAKGAGSSTAEPPK